MKKTLFLYFLLALCILLCSCANGVQSFTTNDKNPGATPSAPSDDASQQDTGTLSPLDSGTEQAEKTTAAETTVPSNGFLRQETEVTTDAQTFVIGTQRTDKLDSFDPDIWAQLKKSVNCLEEDHWIPYEDAAQIIEGMTFQEIISRIGTAWDSGSVSRLILDCAWNIECRGYLVVQFELAPDAVIPPDTNKNKIITDYYTKGIIPSVPFYAKKVSLRMFD